MNRQTDKQLTERRSERKMTSEQRGKGTLEAVDECSSKKLCALREEFEENAFSTTLSRDLFFYLYNNNICWVVVVVVQQGRSIYFSPLSICALA